MSTERFIYVQSNESDLYFSDNRAYKFKVHLKTPLQLHGFWKVALVEFHVTEKAKSPAGTALYIYSDLCKESIVHGEEKRFLDDWRKIKNLNGITLFKHHFICR